MFQCDISEFYFWFLNISSVLSIIQAIPGWLYLKLSLLVLHLRFSPDAKFHKYPTINHSSSNGNQPTNSNSQASWNLGRILYKNRIRVPPTEIQIHLPLVCLFVLSCVLVFGWITFKNLQFLLMWRQLWEPLPEARTRVHCTQLPHLPLLSWIWRALGQPQTFLQQSCLWCYDRPSSGEQGWKSH